MDLALSNGLTLSVLLNPGDMDRWTGWLQSIETKMAREEILPILMEHFAPVVAAEKGILSGHSKSGALEASLFARSGSGDRPGTMSVFSAPTATTKQLATAWGRGRGQQRRWSAGLVGKKGRRGIFYASMADRGHRVVKRKANGELYDTGKRTQGIGYVSGAMEQTGDVQADAAANAILNHITGGD